MRTPIHAPCVLGVALSAVACGDRVRCSAGVGKTTCPTLNTSLVCVIPLLEERTTDTALIPVDELRPPSPAPARRRTPSGPRSRRRKGPGSRVRGSEAAESFVRLYAATRHTSCRHAPRLAHGRGKVPFERRNLSPTQRNLADALGRFATGKPIDVQSGRAPAPHGRAFRRLKGLTATV